MNTDTTMLRDALNEAYGHAQGLQIALTNAFTDEAAGRGLTVELLDLSSVADDLASRISNLALSLRS